MARLKLIDDLPKKHLGFSHHANKKILWGWKRDIGRQKRMVYFSGNLDLDGSQVYLDNYYFAYLNTVDPEATPLLSEALRDAASRLGHGSRTQKLSIQRKDEFDLVEFALGVPSEEDADRVRRLKMRRPRKSIRQPGFPPESSLEEISAMFPADLYVGSGLSYEAGLPTLCDMHDIFGVDSHTSHGFTVGSADILPEALLHEGEERLRKFCAVHTGAILAEPTFAMRRIAELQKQGLVGTIFTDNVDNLLSKAGAVFQRVRGSGVFNERYNARFTNRSLIVVGVAADRRQIIRQARKHRMKVVVVNPCKKVSPNVTHLDYLRPTDTFFKVDADTFFRGM